MNECGACGLDFGSVAAFDAHRVGRHEYTSTEGLAMDSEDGRRCLHAWELADAVDKFGRLLFAQNAHGRWSLVKSLEWGREARSVGQGSS